MNVNIRKVKPTATIPTYATEGAAGFDLYAAEDVIIAPGETKVVPLGLAFEIPDGYEMQVRPRSGIARKTKLRVQLGTIDADYRGEVGVIVDNAAEKKDVESPCYTRLDGVTARADELWPANTYVIRTGDRICQGIIAPVVRAELKVSNNLSKSERGDGAFGSTGI